MNAIAQAKRRSRASASRGYTAVEVLLALTVLAIGAAGVISMQTGAIEGNLEARKLDTANSIAREWVERLRRDSTLWTLPTAYNQGTANLSNATFLSSNLGSPTGNWFQPPIPGGYPADGLSPAFDIFGRDLDIADAPNAIFCVRLKIDVIANDLLGNPELLRGTVQVFWLRQLAWSANNPLNCVQAGGNPNFDPTANPSTYHFLFASTAIRKNTLGQQ